MKINAIKQISFLTNYFNKEKQFKYGIIKIIDISLVSYISNKDIEKIRKGFKKIKKEQVPIIITEKLSIMKITPFGYILYTE